MVIIIVLQGNYGYEYTYFVISSLITHFLHGRLCEINI